MLRVASTSHSGLARHNGRVHIERITELRGDDFRTLLAASDADGVGFVRRLADEWASGSNRFDRPGEALFVAREGDRVVGIGGLNMITLPRLNAIAPQLLVDDLEAALAYYRDRLGFRVDFAYEGFYAAVHRDGALIHLKCAPRTVQDRAHRKEHEHLDAYIEVSGVGELYDELRSRGAWVLTSLVERPWGHTDFLVEDADGYILCFSQPTG